MTRRALRKWQIKILNLWSCNLTIEHFDTPKSVSVGLNFASFKLCNINHLIHTYELRLLGLSGIWSVADDRVLVNLAIKLIITVSFFFQKWFLIKKRITGANFTQTHCDTALTALLSALTLSCSLDFSFSSDIPKPNQKCPQFSALFNWFFDTWDFWSFAKLTLPLL